MKFITTPVLVILVFIMLLLGHCAKKEDVPAFDPISAGEAVYYYDSITWEMKLIER